MKKILLTTFMVSSFLLGYSQPRFADYQGFVQKKMIEQDSIVMAGQLQNYTLYSEFFNVGVPLKEIFNGEMYDRTNDNLYFLLKPNYYKLYIPEVHILFTVFANSNDKDIPSHFIWLTGEIRKYKHDGITRSNY